MTGTSIIGLVSEVMLGCYMGNMFPGQYLGGMVLFGAAGLMSLKG